VNGAAVVNLCNMAKCPCQDAILHVLEKVLNFVVDSKQSVFIIQQQVKNLNRFLFCGIIV
jgi:hypothetical protein